MVGSVPAGFRMLRSSEFFCVGDIVADCSGMWRGPITADSDMVGRSVREYLCPGEFTAAPVIAAARPTTPNAKPSGGKGTHE